MLIVTLFLFLSTNNFDILQELNNANHESIICNNNSSIAHNQIDCASDLKIVFTNAEKLDFFGSEYMVQGYILADDSFQEKISNVDISFGSLNSNTCKILERTRSNHNGEFEIVVKRKSGKFLQFQFVGFKSILIRIKNN